MNGLINQPNSHSGCGIAVFAMASCKYSFPEADTIMSDNSWLLPNKNVRVKDMKNALESVFGENSIKISYLEPKDQDKYLLFVKFRNEFRHWVFVKNGKYYDPLPRFTSPRDSINYVVTRALYFKS